MEVLYVIWLVLNEWLNDHSLQTKIVVVNLAKNDWSYSDSF